ncbi:metallophosphoesterase [Pyrococcus abyssi]|uniref:Exonuclease sbcd related n=1 Tax=Pyrococcus abyssi (strain GE5 / Orsay) TaxID=272844 RepID=Q9UYV7_PYRAB|nr:metallophosphoesterase [Pyrococcus abyssi]CAB50305.1 Dexonuclease sbcD related protein [Pyrococcus abyssi GE5]CCE70843.1 TPA: exonuclease sbcd related [Pyrococcus abyssi GE5]
MSIQDFSSYSFVFKTRLGRTLVLADPHLAFEPFKGINVRSKLEKKLANFIKSQDVDAVIILGDVKEEIGLSGFTEKVLQEFFAELKELGIIITKGNHDGRIEDVAYRFDNVEVLPYFLDKEILFIHGHSRLPDVKFKKIVMGHIHPSTIVSLGRVKKKMKCFLRTPRIIVFPTINPFYEGMDLKQGVKLSPVLRGVREFEIIIPPGIYLSKVTI